MVITARSLGRGRVTVLTLNLFQLLLFQYVFLAGRELSKLAIRRVHICLSVRIRVADPIDRISRRTALRLRPTAVLDELLLTSPYRIWVGGRFVELRRAEFPILVVTLIACSNVFDGSARGGWPTLSRVLDLLSQNGISGAPSSRFLRGR